MSHDVDLDASRAEMRMRDHMTAVQSELYTDEPPEIEFASGFPYGWQTLPWK